MAESVRMMMWHEALAAQLQADLQEAFQRSEIQAAWHQAVRDFRIWWELSSKRAFPLGPDEPCMRELVTLFQQHEPDVAEVYGRSLHVFLLQGIFRERGIQWPEPWAMHIEALAPDNPLRLTADGTLAGWQEAEAEHFFQLEHYRASIKPTEDVKRPVHPQGKA